MRRFFLIFIALALIVVVAFIAEKQRIQQGRFLPGLSSLFRLAFPPDDLWTPLASTSLDSSKTKYEFTFHHKYSGQHEIDIVFPKTGKTSVPQHNLSLLVSIASRESAPFHRSSSRISSFDGISEDGLSFITYSVPDDVPVLEQVVATITLKGDIRHFLDQYGNAQLIIRKASDK